MARGHQCLVAAGRNLAKMRARKGWSRKQLARLAGLKEGILAKMEAGSTRIELAAWDRLSRCIDIPLAVLFSGQSFLGSEPEKLTSLAGLSQENIQIVRELAEVFRNGSSMLG